MPVKIQTSTRGGKIVFGVLCSIVGTFLLIGAVSTLSDDEVTCGGRVMQPGDVCKTTRKGRTTSRGYEEQKESDQTGGYVMLGFVVVGYGVAAYQFVSAARMGRKAAPAADPGMAGSFPPPGQQPAPQGWGQPAPVGAPAPWGAQPGVPAPGAPAPGQPVAGVPPMAAPAPGAGVGPMGAPAPAGYPPAAPAPGAPLPGGFPPPPPGNYPPQQGQWGNQPPQWGAGPR
ncbi:hypothetical protein [Streptoalloteichus hindustanus]|uniref:Uncharacterized protein n=1 Tax=Streptoalloteichus hindustanus TaxID=2017 RepID=A0A1M4W198_STRHI|nr:hypothetical protein [Streptoalloteichus hindustanus]SHE74999.1 hypothetical protein SAMN05444320_101965 [Streptoalloteichus hindustanus]